MNLQEQIHRIQSMMGVIDETKSDYKEIEFVCHNSDSKTSTDRNSQMKLYDDLKKLLS